MTSVKPLEIPVPSSRNLEEEAPSFRPFKEDLLNLTEFTKHQEKILVESLSTFLPQTKNTYTASLIQNEMKFLSGEKPRIVSNRRWQTVLDVSQGNRGSCWAFAGVAALEAAYARKGIVLNLSEQYLFHISKAHENHVNNGSVSSLIGGQGSADVISHLTYWAVPDAENVPYLLQGQLENLSKIIPGTGSALSAAGSGTQDQIDWFEFDLRNIPLTGRWLAQYKVKSFGSKANFSNEDVKGVLAAGFDVLVDVNDKVNHGGHVLLIYGYNDDTRTFDIKNSQSLPGFSTMKYENDSQFDIIYNSMYYITDTSPIEPQWGSKWIGRWETDHDGWRGKLIIRRFCDIRSGNLLPGPDTRISLGTWYGENGQKLDVVGHFIDNGRGLHCNIGTQPFELYLHSSDPYHASGRCFYNNIPYGVMMSRGNVVGAGADSGFNRVETIGIWDLVHDGWRGSLNIGATPLYIQDADGIIRHTWIDPATADIPHKVDAHIDFGGDNRNQGFQLLAHTREDGMLGGVTSWDGRYWPAEGRLAKNLYTITNDGKLYWYRNPGRARLSAEWDDPKVVGTGWGNFHQVFSGGDGIVYAVRTDGVLLWYNHKGRNQGDFIWDDPKEVGTGWNHFKRIFSGDGGVIYAITEENKLLWYRHLGRRDGSARWQGSFEVGTGWGNFIMVTGGTDGCIYGVQSNGTLLWYRHYGYDQGYSIWHGPVVVGSGWQSYDKIISAGNGYMYGRSLQNNGDLWLWRHHGFLTGAFSWTEGKKVGNGWSAEIKEVFAT